MGEEYEISFQQLLLEFGLGCYRLVHSKEFDRKQKVKENKAGSDAHSNTPQEKWKHIDL